MKTFLIEITAEEFGNVARDGMTHGFDVTAYLIRSATASAKKDASQQPTPQPPSPKPAPTTGMFDNMGVA